MPFLRAIMTRGWMSLWSGLIKSFPSIRKPGERVFAASDVSVSSCVSTWNILSDCQEGSGTGGTNFLLS